MIFRQLRHCVWENCGLKSWRGPSRHATTDAAARDIKIDRDHQKGRDLVSSESRIPVFGALRKPSRDYSPKNKSTRLRSDNKYMVNKVSGPFIDGLTRYELDFLDDVNWVKFILTSMKNIATGKSVLFKNKANRRKDRLNCPICFEQTKTYNYDFTKKNDQDNKVVMYAVVKNLHLNAAEMHKLRVIAGPHYDQATDTIRLTSEYEFDFKDSATVHSIDKLANKAILYKALSELISDSRDHPEEFAEIPMGVGNLTSTPSLAKQTKPRKKMNRRQRLLLLRCRTKQKFEYNTNRKKHNFIL